MTQFGEWGTDRGRVRGNQASDINTDMIYVAIWNSKFVVSKSEVYMYKLLNAGDCTDMKTS